MRRKFLLRGRGNRTSRNGWSSWMMIVWPVGDPVEWWYFGQAIARSNTLTGTGCTDRWWSSRDVWKIRRVSSHVQENDLDCFFRNFQELGTAETNKAFVRQKTNRCSHSRPLRQAMPSGDTYLEFLPKVFCQATTCRAPKAQDTKTLGFCWLSFRFQSPSEQENTMQDVRERTLSIMRQEETNAICHTPGCEDTSSIQRGGICCVCNTTFRRLLERWWNLVFCGWREGNSVSGYLSLHLCRHWLVNSWAELHPKEYGLLTSRSLRHNWHSNSSYDCGATSVMKYVGAVCSVKQSKRITGAIKPGLTLCYNRSVKKVLVWQGPVALWLGDRAKKWRCCCVWLCAFQISDRLLLLFRMPWKQVYQRKDCEDVAARTFEEEGATDCWRTHSLSSHILFKNWYEVRKEEGLGG